MAQLAQRVGHPGDSAVSEAKAAARGAIRGWRGFRSQGAGCRVDRDRLRNGRADSRVTRARDRSKCVSPDGRTRSPIVVDRVPAAGVAAGASIGFGQRCVARTVGGRGGGRSVRRLLVGIWGDVTGGTEPRSLEFGSVFFASEATPDFAPGRGQQEFLHRDQSPGRRESVRPAACPRPVPVPVPGACVPVPVACARKVAPGGRSAQRTCARGLLRGSPKRRRRSSRSRDTEGIGRERRYECPIN